MRKSDDSRRERILAKVIADIQLDPNNPLHDGPVSTVDDEQLASEVNRAVPWLKGNLSWTEWINLVRRVATRGGYLKGNAQVAAYVRGDKTDPTERLQAMKGGADKGLSLNAEWPEPTEEQRRAAGTFPTRVGAQCSLSIQLGLGADGRAGGVGARPVMSPERVRQVVEELLSNRGYKP
jgi:hypothetical protein